MTTKAQLRKAATGLPGVEEGTHSGEPTYSVNGKRFAAETKDGQVRLRLPPDRADVAVSAYPSGERVVRNGKTIGFHVPLADVNGKDLNDLVYEAWKHCAPKRLVASVEVENAAAVQGDLPAAIGKPATRALVGAGLPTLADVAERTEAELLAMHGVGPKAVRILRESLADQGMSLR